MSAPPATSASPPLSLHDALPIFETSAVPQIFRLAVDGLRGLGTCVLVGSARAGTEVSFEMPWLQGGRTVRGVVQGDSRRSEEHTSELQSRFDLVCRLLLEKKKNV